MRWVHDTIAFESFSLVLRSTFKDGRCPLYYACVLGKIETAKLCIRNGADVNARDLDEYTALHGTAIEGGTEMCRLLLDHGAKINCRDVKCKTALHEACSRNHYETATMLVKRGADMSAEEYLYGRTGL